MYLVQCAGFNQFFIDNVEYRADAYADNWWFGDDFWITWPVQLAQGSHALKVHLAGTAFQCTCVPSVDNTTTAPSPLIALYAQNPSVSAPDSPREHCMLPASNYTVVTFVTLLWLAVSARFSLVLSAPKSLPVFSFVFVKLPRPM